MAKRYKLEIKEKEYDPSFIFQAISTIQQMTKEYEKSKSLELQGIIECPKCGNKLHYTISSYNGHIWGKCETDKCLVWMM